MINAFVFQVYMEGLEGEDFSFYNKCVFKTIPLHDLKCQLEKRDVHFFNFDSYHILILRLKLKILEHNHIQASTQEIIREELELYEHSKKRKKSVYECCVAGCSFKSLRHSSYLSHLRLAHYNSQAKLVCNYKHQCQSEFSVFLQLKNHISKDHLDRSRYSNKFHGRIVEEMVTIKCCQTSCGHQSVTSIEHLKKHIFEVHLKAKEDIGCIFCEEFTTNVIGTMKSHMSRKHRYQSVANLSTKYTRLGERVTEVISPEPAYAEMSNDSNDDVYDTEDNEVKQEVSVESELLFVKALAITFNSWMNVSGIAYKTVNSIVKEVFESYNRGRQYTKAKILEILEKSGIASEHAMQLATEVDDQDPFEVAKDELLKESKRKKFILESFPNVQPVTVKFPVSSKNEKADTYQYVPIKESLRILMEDDTYISQVQEDPYFHEEDVYKDSRDGTHYRENPFFIENPDAVPLLVFQDELEIANPLGAAKTKHKINCTYYSSMEIQAPLRSKVSSIQLVSLVLSRHWKKFGNSLCNQRFISDLQDLETNGLDISKPVKTVRKVGLMYIMGDNLGAHTISELSQSFSSGLICRWCKASYQEVCKDACAYRECRDDVWTREDYNRLASEALATGDEIDGVKGHCAFNKLRSFHCIGQLPPCLGHDFYEGVFSYDIQFYLDYLINKEKLISMEELNRRIKGAILSKRDSKNRPKEFKCRKKNSKYEGSAGSLRVLSRILTLLITDEIEKSIIGSHIIKLQEVSEILTAPRLTRYEVENKMKFIVFEYLDLRASAIVELGMDSMKPKHHFIGHYHELYTIHGPLIHLWAMRMEVSFPASSTSKCN